MAGRGPSDAATNRFRANLERLIGPDPGKLGVALSGGPDSVALMVLTAAAYPGRVEAATVDHGLRPESADEAAFAAGLCAEWEIVHAILRPEAPIRGSIQAEARKVRYALLEQWRAERGLHWILTGHHADDQAETLLMRLNRGAGVGGLAGVRATNGRVLRPLLDWRRDELAQLVAAAGIEPVADPSNADERFDRARLRKAMAGADWIDPARLGRSAATLAAAEEALEWAAADLARARLTVVESGAELDASGLPGELGRRLVLRALRAVAPAAEPRGEEVDRLIATLRAGGTATLAGVQAKGGKSWRFSLARARRSAGPQTGLA